MDDLLDLYENTDAKPFTDVPATPKYVKYEKKAGAVNTWEDVNITPLKINKDDLLSGAKGFTVIVFKGENGIKPELEETIFELCKILILQGRIIYN